MAVILSIITAFIKSGMIHRYFEVLVTGCRSGSPSSWDLNFYPVRRCAHHPHPTDQ